MGEIFEQTLPGAPMEWTGERWTTNVGGQVEIEHLHRYLFARDICRGLDVLDVASGEGYGTALLAQVANMAIGVEISSVAAGHAALQYKKSNLRYLHGDARAIPLADHSVDVVISFETIEHFYEQETFLSEVKRVLRPGGRLVISSPDRDIYSPAGSPANPYHVRELSRIEFEGLLSRYFGHVRLLCQRPILGSILLNDDGDPGPTVTVERRGPHHFERNEGVPRPLYLFAIASDTVLPPLPNSVFIDDDEIGQIIDRAAALSGVQSRLTETLHRAEAAETAFHASRTEIATHMHEAEQMRDDLMAQLRTMSERLREAEAEAARPNPDVAMASAASAAAAAALSEVEALTGRLAEARADLLQACTDRDQACTQRDTARSALRRGAVFAEYGWKGRVAELERSLRETQENASYWKLRHDRLRIRLDQVLRRSGLFQVSRLMPRSLRRFVRERLS